MRKIIVYIAMTVLLASVYSAADNPGSAAVDPSASVAGGAVQDAAQDTAKNKREDKTPKVVFDSPSNEAIWTGEREISFRLENIDSPSVRVVEVYLDGRLLKDFVGPPYTLKHSFGGGKNRLYEAALQAARGGPAEG